MVSRCARVLRTNFVSMKNFLILIAVLFLTISSSSATDWNVVLEKVDVVNMPGIQSFAAGEIDGKVVIIGGLVGGRHERQPPNAFPVEDKNFEITVLDVETLSVKKATFNNLETPLVEQFAATNHEFGMWGHHMILIGGYGFSPTADDHITYPRLTLIDLRGMAADIEAGEDFSDRIRTLEDDRMANTGGRLAINGDTIMLVGGHASVAGGSTNTASNAYGPRTGAWREGIPVLRWHPMTGDIWNYDVQTSLGSSGSRRVFRSSCRFGRGVDGQRTHRQQHHLQ